MARRSLLVGAALALLVTACGRAGPVASGPSLLLVTIDTLRADHVGAYGAGPDRTPSLDELAARGVVFERVFAPTPLTLPSHASLLTGLYPPSHGVRHNGLYRLEAEVPRLPEVFREAGYRTGAFVGATVLDGRFGLGGGFGTYDASWGAERASATGFPERDARSVTDAALRWLEEDDAPFFLWVHYYDPHAAYHPPEPWASRFAGDPYAGEIAFVDAQLGRLLGALAGDGRLASTLVAVTADHGESLGAHGETTHGYTLYDATQHVPWILAGPGIPKGGRVDALASLVDVAPTLLARTGLSGLAGAEGRDLSPWIDGGAPPESERVVYAESLATRLDHGWAPLHAARSLRHLYVRAPRPELYDVRSDPRQQHDLLAEDAPAVEPVVAALEDRIDQALREDREAERVALDPAVRRELQALGYVLPERTPEATGRDPKDGLPLVRRFVLAKSLFAEGRAEEARRLAEALRDELPESPELEELLARLALQRGDREGALHHARRSVALGQGSAARHVLLGYAELAAGASEEAARAFERAAALDPTLPDAQVGLMWRVLTGGTEADAARAAERALAAAPRDPALALQVADTWERLGRYDRAREAYRRVLELAPDHGLAHLGLAANAIRLGAFDEAEPHLERAGPAATTLPARMRIAIAYAVAGASDRAEARLRAVLRDHPQFDGARRVLARLLEQTGRGREAHALREEAGAS